MPKFGRWTFVAGGMTTAFALIHCGGDDGASHGGPEVDASFVVADATVADSRGSDDGEGTTAATPDAGGAPDADASNDASLAFRLAVSDASVVSTYDQRVALGFKYGYVDGVLGALKNGADYALFASGHTQPDAGLCPGTPDTQGAYRLGTALDAITTNYGCKALIEDSVGGSPDGGTLGAFDRDYVGGGPVMRVPNPDGGTPAVIMVYHAEFHWGPQCGAENAACFYGTLGLAFSFDDGATFEKLGEIVQPNVSRPDWIAAHPNESLAIGAGPFLIGDGNRRAIDPTTADPATSFIYVYYVDDAYADAGVACASADGQCLGVARANLQSVIDAAFSRDEASAPTLFKKYHEGAFDQPAASGDPNDAVPSGLYTALESATFEISVLYDRAINQAIMAAKAGTHIEFRTTSDLAIWPQAAMASAIVTAEGDGGLRYPSLIGEVESTNVGATAPWLFYTNGDTWKTSVFESRRLDIVVTR